MKNLPIVFTFGICQKKIKHWKKQMLHVACNKVCVEIKLGLCIYIEDTNIEIHK